MSQRYFGDVEGGNELFCSYKVVFVYYIPLTLSYAQCVVWTMESIVGFNPV